MKKWKMVMAASLAVVLGIGTACGGGNGGNPSGPAGDGTSGGTGSADQAGMSAKTGSEEKPEEVTITIYAISTGENPMTSGIQDDPVSRYIREKTGVTLDVTVSDSNKTNAMVASGDLMDINVFGNVTYVEPLIKTGALNSLDDYMAYLPEVTNNFPELVEYSRSYLSAGSGKLYILPERAKMEASPVATSQEGNFIRWDYYKEAGCPEITSLDAYLDLLETIQKNHPTTESGKKTYPMYLFTDWGAGAYATYFTLCKYMGYDITGGYGTYFLKDWVYRDLYDDSNGFWLESDLFFKGWQRGLVDPESFTQKHENVTQKLTEGQYLVSPNQWQIQTVNIILNEETGGTGGFVDIPFADTEEFTTWVNRSTPFGYIERMFFISSKCDEKKMRGIARFLNFIYSEEGSRVIMNGVPGEDWEYLEDGSADFTAETAAKIKEDPNYALARGMNKYLGAIGWDYDSYASNGEFLDIRLNGNYIKENMMDFEREYCEFYGVELPLQAVTQRKHQEARNNAISCLAPTDIPTEISRIKTKVENYLMQEFPNLVMSEDRAAYDSKLQEIREGLKEMDYDKLRDFYEEAFENAKQEYERLLQ